LVNYDAIPHSIHKIQVAVFQLRNALTLYYNGSYVSAITLAGAAEEILAKCSDHAMSDFLGGDVQHNHNEMSSSFLAITLASAIPGYDSLNQNDKETVYNDWAKAITREFNTAKNQLKHKSEGQTVAKSPSFKEDAEKYISTAIINYKLYKKALPVNDPLIMKYCEERGII